MSRLRSLPLGAWIAIGLIASAILVPASAVATTSLVGLVGANGVRAAVTNAAQLKTTEASPATYLVFNRNGLVPGPGNCMALTQNVGTRGYVIKQVVFNVFLNETPGQGEFVALFADNACTKLIAIETPPTVGTFVYPIDPGYAVQSGGGLWAQAFGHVQGGVTTYGYTVPASDVPFATPNSSRGPSLPRSGG
jgi:xanthosine utilization system XapX-like protein